MLKNLLPFLLLFGPLAASAYPATVSSVRSVTQTRTVSGTVLSAKENEPLPGASVVVKGTTRGTVTGADGTFKLEVPAEATTLVISYIGMQPQEVAISSSPLRITLQSSGKDLDEYVVIAYGTAKKSTYTGAVSQIKGDQLVNRQISSVSNALQGLAPGVQSTTQSGQPGADATIRIRGVGSINASSDPLYVVDGVPYGGSINAINPYDIESVSVLKDAASSALYGSRGANGVIIITTKKGRKGASNIDVRVSQGFSSRAVKDYPQVSTDDYFTMYWEALRNGAPRTMTPTQAKQFASSNLISRLGVNPYGSKFPEPVDTSGRLVPGASALWNDNWTDAMSRTGKRTEADISINGASDKARYFISGGYLNDQGIYLGSGFKRYNVRTNLDLDVKPWLKVGVNLSGAHSSQDAPPSEDSRTDNYVNYGRLMSGIYPVYQRDENGNEIRDKNGDRVFDYGDYRPSAANPNSNLVQTSRIDKHNQIRDDISMRAYGEADIWKGLKFKTSYNADYSSRNRHDYTNPLLGFDAEVGGTVSKTSYRIFSWTFNNILTYEQTFNQKHHINLLAGQEAYKYTWTYGYGERSGFSLPGLDEPAAASLLKDYTGYTDKYALSSYLGRAEYDYDQRYFFSASLRTDGSSRFAPKNRWGTFWSLGASWKLSQEQFLKNATWLNLLTVRASYGAQGNDNLGDAGTGKFYTYKFLYQINSNLGEGGTFRENLYNPMLKWETNLNLNLGVDFSMFKNRLGGSVEFFRRSSRDLLYSKPLALSTGYSAIDQNIGALKNTGVDVNLNAIPVQTKDFSWKVDLNLTHYKNEITSLPQKEIINNTKKLMVGHSIYDFWLRKWAGVDPSNGLPTWYVTDEQGKTTTTTEYAKGSQYYVGSSLPDLYGGLTNTFRYKNLSFSFLITYSLGGKILDNDVTFLMHTGTSAGRAWHTDMLDRWTPQNTNTDIPKLTTANTNWTAASTRWLYDASYARLKSVNLSYSLPKSLMDRAHLNNVTIYVQGDNLITVFGHKGMDPEQSVGGTTYYRYPANKAVSAGINLNF